MANKKISELSSAGALTGTESVEIVQGGANVKTTTQDIADLGGGGSGTWGSITGTLSSQTDLQSALNSKLNAIATIVDGGTNYTLQASDLTLINAGATVIIEGDGTGTLTVPLDATVDFPDHSFIGFRGFILVAFTGGITETHTNDSLDCDPELEFTWNLEKRGTNTWNLTNGTPGGGGSLDGVELLENKATDFSTLNNTKYPTTEAVVEKLSARETKTDDYATIQADNQKTIILNAATAKTITVDQLTSDSYMTFVNINTGQWNLSEGSGVTIHGSTSFLPGGEVNSLTLWWLTATAVYVISGASASVNTLSVNGALAVRAGLSAGVIAKVGGIIHTNTTAAGNVGTGEDDIFLFNVPANTLASDKSSIVAVAAGTFAANANNKRLRVRFGGTQIFDSTAVAINSGDWAIEIQIYRTGAATQKTVVSLRTSSATLVSTVDYATAAVDLSTPLDLKITGEATSNDDITGQIFKVRYEPME